MWIPFGLRNWQCGLIRPLIMVLSADTDGYAIGYVDEAILYSESL
jgi:hypothetical protein